MSIHATYCLIPKAPPLWRHDSALVKAAALAAAEQSKLLLLCLSAFLLRCKSMYVCNNTHNEGTMGQTMF